MQTSNKSDDTKFTYKKIKLGNNKSVERDIFYKFGGGAAVATINLILEVFC